MIWASAEMNSTRKKGKSVTRLCEQLLFALGLAAKSIMGCGGPAEMPTRIDVRQNADEIRRTCSETSIAALGCVGFDSDGNSLFEFRVRCPAPPNAGGFYDDVNNTEKPLHHPDIQKRLALAQGGVSCMPSEP